jgi:hypothetical protein
MKLAAVGIACIVLGAGLSHLPMLGLLGLPLVLGGGGVLTIAITRAREDDGMPRLRNAVGLLLEVPAGFGVMLCALYSTGLAWKYLLGIQRSGTGIYRVDAKDLAMAAMAWFLIPSFVTLGIYLRTGWDSVRLLGWWVLTFSSQPAAVLCFMVFASSAPLST